MPGGSRFHGVGWREAAKKRLVRTAKGYALQAHQHIAHTRPGLFQIYHLPLAWRNQLCCFHAHPFATLFRPPNFVSTRRLPAKVCPWRPQIRRCIKFGIFPRLAIVFGPSRPLPSTCTQFHRLALALPPAQSRAGQWRTQGNFVDRSTGRQNLPFGLDGFAGYYIATDYSDEASPKSKPSDPTGSQ